MVSVIYIYYYFPLKLNLDSVPYLCGKKLPLTYGCYLTASKIGKVSLTYDYNIPILYLDKVP